MKKISAHMVVKNEQHWVWFAIQSLINHVDEFLILDTGSSDATLSIIKTISDPKISLDTYSGGLTPAILTDLRQKLLERSTGDWILIVDGDEIWTDSGARELIDTINFAGDNYDFLVTPCKNLLGDVFHCQSESAGRYHIGPYRGHLTIRAVNLNRLPGLHFSNDYPLEGLHDADHVLIQSRHPLKTHLMTYPYLHATFLHRAGHTRLNSQTLSRSAKFKYELGNRLPADFSYPSCFYFPRPRIVPSPWSRRNLWFTLKAAWQTPFKLIKRRIFN